MCKWIIRNGKRISKIADGTSESIVSSNNSVKSNALSAAGPKSVDDVDMLLVDDKLKAIVKVKTRDPEYTPVSRALSLYR